MNKFKNIIYILGLSVVFILTNCTEPDDEVLSIDYDRLFSPTELTTRVVSRTNILLTWNSVKNADSYTIEVHNNGNLNFDGTPAKTLTGITTTTYTITGLDGETAYSIRVQAVGSGKNSSKWVTGTATTDTEQIFKSLIEEELLATQVTLRWTAGAEVTTIGITPGNIVHTITSEEKAAGAATITGLTGETAYTATLFNNTKTRGTLTFTTLIDLGDAKGIYPEDDILAILDAAEDGDSFVLFAGEYTIGDYALTKSVSLSGYKVSEKPVIYGRFTCGATVSSLSLKNLIMDGQQTTINLFEVGSNCDISAITIAGCEIRNYARALIYNNTTNTSIGDVLVTDCIMTDTGNNGGDGIDLRAGTIKSLTIEKSTFDTGFRAFLRLQSVSNVVFNSCTFYRICNVDNNNNSGLFRSSGGGTLNVSNCLFVETGIPNPTNASSGNWCRNSNNMAATATYSKNVYYNCYNLWVGLYTNPADCSATEANPQFTDPENGDFTVNNMIVTAGDPRWQSN